MIRSYSHLVSLATYEERLEYLRLRGSPGKITFGGLRHLNQSFYGSSEWRSVRNLVINRDFGCDLGVRGHDICERVVVHHMNLITPDTLIHEIDLVLSPEFLITTSFNTHQIIHFGQNRIVKLVPRRAGDTMLW